MPYKYESEQITYPQTQVRANCNGILFINSGGAAVRINNFSLLPNSSLSLDTQDKEIDKTIYSISWPSGATQAELTIWRKFYV